MSYFFLDVCFLSYDAVYTSCQTLHAVFDYYVDVCLLYVLHA